MIHGLTPTLAEGGKIKIGGLGAERTSKSGNKYRVPLKFDHFLVTKTERDAKGDLARDQAIMDALPKDQDGKVRAIPIVLHSDTLDEVFPTSYALYTGKRLGCRGDGQVAMRWEIDKAGNRTGKTQEIKCPCPLLEEGTCKPHGTLHCSIAIESVAVAGVVHRWRTTSIISIKQMLGSLQQILSLCGTLRGVPLWLRVQPKIVTPADGPSTTVYCCHVELRAKDVLAIQTKALKALQMRRALGGDNLLEYRNLVAPPAGPQESAEEQEEIAAEFHPEPEAIEAAADEQPATAPKIRRPEAIDEPGPVPATDPAPASVEPEVLDDAAHTEADANYEWVTVLKVSSMKAKNGSTRYTIQVQDVDKKQASYWVSTFSDRLAEIADTGRKENEAVMLKRTQIEVDGKPYWDASDIKPRPF